MSAAARKLALSFGSDVPPSEVAAELEESGYSVPAGTVCRWRWEQGKGFGRGRRLTYSEPQLQLMEDLYADGLSCPRVSDELAKRGISMKAITVRKYLRQRGVEIRRSHISEDERRRIKKRLRKHPDWSYRKLAEREGVSIHVVVHCARQSRAVTGKRRKATPKYSEADRLDAIEYYTEGKSVSQVCDQLAEDGWENVPCERSVLNWLHEAGVRVRPQGFHHG